MPAARASSSSCSDVGAGDRLQRRSRARSTASASRPRLVANGAKGERARRRDLACGGGARRAGSARQGRRSSCAQRAAGLPVVPSVIASCMAVRTTARRSSSTMTVARPPRALSRRSRRCISRTISAPIRRLLQRQPQLPQVACFDTAFHRGHPEVADRYALPERFYARGRAPLRLPRPVLRIHRGAGSPDVAPDIADGRVVVAHLGSGASMCAIMPGKSVESTMGFTALDGLPMGTRPGQLDPGVVLYLMTEKGMSARRDRASALQRLRARRASPASATTCATCSRAPIRAPSSRSTISSTASRSSPGCLRPPWAASTASSSPPASARTRPPSARPSRSAWPGSALELDPEANAKGDARISTPGVAGRLLRHSDRRGADDRPPHAARPARAAGTRSIKEKRA